MPLKIIPPRKAEAKSLYIRGTYLGVYVDKSSGTDRRSVAAAVLKRIEGQIERGEYGREAAPGREQPTFVSAAVTYMENGGEARYMAPIIRHFGETPLDQIDQPAIDAAAVAILPHASGATRNRCIYTPVSSVLHAAGIDLKVARPKGAKGRVVTDFLAPADAAAIIAAAETFDREYALLLTFLLYTGCRLGEALGLRWQDVRLEEGGARVRETKNGDPRELRLREDLCRALAEHQHEGARVFRFRQGGHLKHLLTRAKLAALGMDCPVRRPTGWRCPPHRLAWVNHHTFRHTWATWFRRYGGGDVQGLVATGNWRDPRSAARYAHVVARDEWSRVESLPDLGKIRGVKAS